MNYNKPLQKGFTIVELMIALLIGLFLSAGAIQIFLGTKENNRMQENLSRMQENARFAMHFLTEDIRKVAFDGGVCGRGRILNNAINRLDVSSAVSPYIFKGLPTQSAASTAIIGFNSLSGAISGLENVGLNNSDEITIRALSALSNGVDVIAPLVLNTDDLQINVSEAGVFVQGDIVLVTDCKYSDIFQITDDPATGALEHATGSTETPDNKTNQLSLGAYTANTKVYKLSSGTGLLATTYAVANGAGSPGLTRRIGGAVAQQLVPDIESMQIEYGQRKFNGDMFFVPAGTVDLDMNDVMSVRISLLVRSRDDFIATPGQPYFFNNSDVSGAAIPDNRLRKVYTSTIAVRNRLN